VAFLYFIAALLAVGFVWGLLWPRSQWRVLASWTRRNPDQSEPGPVAYGVHRALSGLGVATFVAVGTFMLAEYVMTRPAQKAPVTALQEMWGVAPEPQIVDRVVLPDSAPDPNFVAESILGYQVFDNVSNTPRYLAFLDVFAAPGSNPGYLGVSPGTGFSALDSAELVVNIRVKSQCVPRQVVIVESESVVQIGVFSGLPGEIGGIAGDNAFCAGGSLTGASLLLPINLGSAIGDRHVQTLDGSAIPEVEAIEPR
jgi:hypothetical protein